MRPPTGPPGAPRARVGVDLRAGWAFVSLPGGDRLDLPARPGHLAGLLDAVGLDDPGVADELAAALLDAGADLAGWRPGDDPRGGPDRVLPDG